MIYTIEQGNHSANGLNFGIHSNGVTVKKTVRFLPNCHYNLGNENQFDINKLYGFSVGLLQSNQFNSARFGWRWSIKKQKIELLAYVYINGVRINEWDIDTLICNVELNAIIKTQISIEGPHYRFEVIGTEGGVKHITRSGSGAGYNQYPYFGGNEVAPHTMHIEFM